MGQPVTGRRASTSHRACKSGLESTWEVEGPFDVLQDLYQVDSTTALKILQDPEFDIFIGALF